MTQKIFPHWLRKRCIADYKVTSLRSLLKDSRVNTVCQSARCPNMGECFQKGRATFLILGDICTRNCGYCGIKKGRPEGIDKNEPKRIACVVRAMCLEHVIITSVTRDDLPDGGAKQFRDCIDELRKSANVKIEVLTPDFNGSAESLEIVLNEKIDLFAHNVETVPRLYKKLRPRANYERSLYTLKKVRNLKPDLAIKSGLMVGLGEKEQEILEVMSDLRESGCSIITIGQYLRPSKSQVEVSDFIHPETFEEYKDKAYKLGFKSVSCGPFVRSSYMS